MLKVFNTITGYHWENMTVYLEGNYFIQNIVWNTMYPYLEFILTIWF